MSAKKDAGVLAVFTGLLAIYSVLSENEFFGFMEEITWETYYLTQIIFLVILVVTVGQLIAILLGGGGVGQFFKDLFSVGTEAKRFAKESDAKKNVKPKEVFLTREEKKLKKLEKKRDCENARKEWSRMTKSEKKDARLKKKIEKAKQKAEKKAQREVLLTATMDVSDLGGELNLRKKSLDPVESALSIRGDKNLRFAIIVTLLIAAFVVIIICPNIILKIYEVLP